MASNIRKTILFLVCSYTYATGLEPTLPRCPPPPAMCKRVKMSDAWQLKYNTYSVNEIFMDVSILDTKEIGLSCYLPSLSLDDDAFPKFERTMYFESLNIEECALPEKSYRQTLNKLKIAGFHNLTVVFENCNQNTVFAEQHFLGLHNLESLKISCTVFDLEYLDFSILNPLKNLKKLELKNILVKPFPSRNRLRSVKISDGGPVEKLQPWGECEELEQLMITNWKVIELPKRWLATCSRLSSLHLEDFPRLSKLPQEMIHSTSLISLTITNCQLEDLPKDFLDHAQYLRTLNLSSNNLGSLDRNMFSSIPLLETLVLSSNRLLVNSISALAPLIQLQSLSLDNNLQGDTCRFETNENPYEVMNPWPLLPSLEQLSLQNTRASVLCLEWGLSMPKLRYINLRKTHIRTLRYEDIELIRDNGWDVNLYKNDFTDIYYDENDYKAAVDNLRPNTNNATIRISEEPLICDCRWYRFALILIYRPGYYVSVPDLRCINQWGRPDDPDTMRLDQIPSEHFICEIDSERGCQSYWRIHSNTTQVNCTNAGLDHVPQVPRLREIHMANNHVDKLHIGDLPETLEYLDLRYNQLSAVDKESALVMFSRPIAHYYFKGNPISCLCNNRAWINALQIHQTQVKDYEEVTCSHGLQIKNVNTNMLCLEEYAPVIAGTLGFIAVLFAFVIIMYYRYKRAIHIILYSRGWCACCVNEKELDKDKTYDVFVSFAYDDASFVMDELVPGLEKGPQAFSVCVHYRDWMAGEWIPNQIAHSVGESRRTVIVLSNNFLNSIWAILEFRTAHTQALKDGRVRLVIVLLDDITNDERMDDELRSYLSTNTYIRWGDPRFWDKLRYALPHHGNDSRRRRSAGEAVVSLLRPNDPPMVLRDGVALEMLGIEPPPNKEIQIEEEDE